MPLNQAVRRILVKNGDDAGWYLDLHYRPVSAMIDCSNSALSTEQLLGLAITEHAPNGLPVFRAFACY
jgi:hypothetical protein